MKTLHAKVVIVTNDDQPVIAHDGRLHTQPTHQVDVIDPIGAGDAFMGGFLCGYLEKGVQWGLEMGSALAALKLTYLGDVAWCSREQVTALIEQRHSSFR